MLPLLGEVLGLHEPALADVLKNRTTLVDGTDIPTRNRKDVGKDNYSGKRHRQGLNIQVAASTSGVLLAVPTHCPAVDTTAGRSPSADGNNCSINTTGSPIPDTKEPPRKRRRRNPSAGN